MKTILSWLAQIIVLAGLGYGAFLFVTKSDDETVALIDQPTLGEATLNLPIETLLPMDITPQYVSLGKVEAWQTSTLASQASGRVVWRCDCFEEGRSVEAGVKLLQLDDINYLRDVVDREKDLGNARTALIEAESETVQARENYARLDLGEPSDIVLKIPEQNAARLAVTSAEAALSIAQNALDETNIMMPYSGIISEVSVSVGDLTGASTKLGAIIGTDRFRVRFPVLETQLSLAQIGAQIVIKSTTVPIITKLGIIEAIDIDIDQSTRLNSVIVSMAAPMEGDILRLGRFVNGTFSGEMLANVFAIPLIAITAENQYYVIGEDGRLVAKDIQPIYRNFQAVFVATEGQSSLEIVTGNVLGLRVGMLVKGYTQ